MLKDRIAAELGQANTDEMFYRLWKYLRVDDPLKPADFVVAMGGRGNNIAEKAAELVLDGTAQAMICTGYNSRDSKWKQVNDDGQLARLEPTLLTEAERFRDVAVARGVNPELIFLELEAKDSKQNVLYSLNLARELSYTPKRVPLRHNRWIWVHYSAQGLRIKSVLQKQANGDVEHLVTQPDDEFIPSTRNFQLVLGNLPRLVKYGLPNEAGETDLVTPNIPPEIWNDYHQLIDIGYGYLIEPKELLTYAPPRV